ncbi:MAG: polysaccharide pyruvyl transferase family protein [Alcaligenes nematophilus]|uniref:polysaccharide pyruvyl transferase family protein n=1 Tax=Alcaligenes nematophilus TaxID=2994643 RepID=UPI003D0487F2
MDIALFNDTSSQAHIGCLAVSDAHNTLLDRAGARIQYRFFVGQLSHLWQGDPERTHDAIAKSYLHNIISNVDALVVNGEGTIHHGAGLDLLAILSYGQALGKKTLLVNCVLQDIPHYHDTLKKLDDLVCRELQTKHYLDSLGIACRVEFDSIIAAGFDLSTWQQSQLAGKILVSDFHPLRNADVGATTELIRQRADTFYFPLDHAFSFQDWRHALSIVKHARLVVTGRHHGVYLSALAGIPFLAMGSNTWKVEGTLELFKKHVGVDFPMLKLDQNIHAQLDTYSIAPDKTALLTQLLREKSRTLSTFDALIAKKSIYYRNNEHQNEPSLGNGIVLAINYVPTKIEPAITAFWEKLSEELAQSGRLLLVASTAELDSEQLNIIQIPFNFVDFHRHSGCAPHTGKPDQSLTTLIENWYACTSKTAEQAVLNGTAFYSELLDTLEPMTVITWQSAHPTSKVLKTLCQTKDIPCLSAERGGLRDSLMFDMGLNNYVSEANTSLIADKAWSSYQWDSSRYQELKNKFFYTPRKSRYQSNPFLEPAHVKRKYAIDEQATIVAWVSHGEPCFQTQNTDSALADLHAIPGPILQEKINEIAAYCIDNGLYLLIQEHPFNKDQAQPLRYPTHERVIVVQEDIASVLGVADHYLFTTASAQYDAIFYQKSYGMLSKSLLHHKQGAFFIQDYPSTASFMHDVLHAPDWDIRLKNMEKRLMFLYDYLFLDISSPEAIAISAQRLFQLLDRFERHIPADLGERITFFLEKHSQNA